MPTDAAGVGAPTRGRFRRLPWGRIALVTAVVLVVVGLVAPLRRGVAVLSSRAILVALSPIAPDIGNFEDLSQGSTVLAADGSVLAELDGAQRREPVRLDALPDHVTRAVLAAEDANFYDHGGIDPTAVLRAVVRNAQGGLQGGSTITQQLAKLNYTDSERTILRKLNEVQYAVRLEERYSKDELLERYLNQVYFGDGAYGLSAASQAFFGTAPEQLTPAQAATLAGKIRAPEALDPRARPDRVEARRDQVLRNMRRHGWLDEGGLQAALAAPLEVVPAAATGGQAPHFVEFVKREAAALPELGASPEVRSKRLFTGGFTIKTTLDPKAQEAAVAAVQAALPDPADPEAAVASVVPGDGAIRILSGGRDFATLKFDLASQGRRQPGSSFKPYVYLAAVADGVDPRSTFDASSPQDFTYRGERYTVHNYEGEGRGRASLDEAMTRSINTVFARLVLDIEPGAVVRTAEALGIHDVAENVGARPAIALGGLRRGVTPLEQATAFAAFAAKGVLAEPYAITEIRDREGKVLFQREPDTRQVFDEKEVGVLNAALLRVVTDGTGQGAAIGRPVAGKTGTTQEYGDAWFVGFVPQLATAVWVGHPDAVVPMTDVHGRRVTGGSFPAAIFAGTMRAAVEPLPAEDIFTASPGALGLDRDDRRPAAPAPTVGTTPPTTAPVPTTVATLPPLAPTLPYPTVVRSPTTTAAATTTTAPRRGTTTTTAPAVTTTTTAPVTTTTAAPTTTSTTTTTTTTTAPSPP
ncbi:MAG TPA: transglycosylase domain-containing protein [Acidimicrobiales bacterium]|nr:transglycosylase domain-containing protein [Acidimicrobiales bacterium]